MTTSAPEPLDLEQQRDAAPRHLLEGLFRRFRPARLENPMLHRTAQPIDWVNPYHGSIVCLRPAHAMAVLAVNPANAWW